MASLGSPEHLVIELEGCPSAVAHSESAAWVQSKSSARRARRFRVAFLSGVQCYQHGAPGLSLTSDEAVEMVASLARHENKLVADGHSPSFSCSPDERPTASCGCGLPPVEGYSRVGIGIAVTVDKPFDISAKPVSPSGSVTPDAVAHTSICADAGRPVLDHHGVQDARRPSSYEGSLAVSSELLSSAPLGGVPSVATTLDEQPPYSCGSGSSGGSPTLDADGHLPSTARSPNERPPTSCGFGLPLADGCSRVGIGTEVGVEKPYVINVKTVYLDAIYEVVADLSKAAEGETGWIDMEQVVVAARLAHDSLTFEVVFDSIVCWEELEVMRLNPDDTMVKFLVPIFNPE